MEILDGNRDRRRGGQGRPDDLPRRERHQRPEPLAGRKDRVVDRAGQGRRARDRRGQRLRA